MPPIRVFYSPLHGRFYASRDYKISPDGIATVTGERDDVTDDIASAIARHDLWFARIPAGEIASAPAGEPQAASSESPSGESPSGD